MTKENKRAGGAKRWLGSLLWVGVGFALSFILFFDPLSIHPVDDWLRPTADSRMSGEGVAAASEEQGGLWTCSMHPHILEDEPGECPICGMTLVRVRDGGSVAGSPASGEREILFYRNPMDPTITSPVPAKDEMGMDYVPVFAEEAESITSGEREILFYRNPMDPTISSPVPAKDEMGMDYVPVYSDEVDQAMGAGTTVTIDSAVVQNMNVQSALAERRDLTHDIRTVGYLEYDQERMVTVTTKYSGWVEKVYVNYVGEPVRKGQPLFEIYSPELVQTEQELLSAIAYAKKFKESDNEARRRAEGLVEAARTRLSYWDIAPEQIARLEETGEIFRTLKVVAPSSGLVMKRMPGLEGMAVKPGMETYHIANLSSLWLSVEIFENQVAWIRENTSAEVVFTYFPGETFRGRVRFIEPEFSEKTRTLRVKLEVPNPGRRLRAGMFATVTFQPVAARGAITVPSLSVLRTGQRNVVVVDLGEGRFSPREVVLGHQGSQYVEVLEGLEDGDRVITSAQFLIDSEASLQEAIQKMIAQKQAAASDQGEGDHAE
ncbi:MAG: efflux RND transporter periplasmic adaptor subunit [Rhodothermales bacterium]|nr:efflux RND transporter periplasmic adaptor subunit [Rhodothermales bacterium]